MNVGQQVGGSARAIELLQEAVASQPTNESAHQHLMRLYASTGNRHLAMNQFRVCVEALKRELDVEPELATTRLFEEIRQGQPTLVEQVRAKQVPAKQIPAGNEPVGEATPFVESAAVASPGVKASVLSRRAWWGIAGAGVIGVAALSSKFIGTRKKDFRSLAVMPLQTKGAASLEYLSSGLTESLIGSLSRSPSLRVMAGSTVYAYEDKSNDPRALGKAVSTLRLNWSRAVENLPVAVKTAIELCYFNELSHSEIAEKLGEPLGTVKTRIRRGLQMMRERMLSENATAR